MINTIQVIRLTSDSDIIAKVIKTTDSFLMLEDPMEIMSSSSPLDGSLTVGLKFFDFFGVRSNNGKLLQLNRDMVMFINEARPAVLDFYVHCLDDVADDYDKKIDKSLRKNYNEYMRSIEDLDEENSDYRSSILSELFSSIKPSSNTTLN